MRKFIAGSLLAVGVASLPTAISPGQTTPAPSRDYNNDPRSHTLRDFFHRWDCPAERYSNTFIEAADVYALDWRLLPSISFVESAGGKAAPNNNMFGWNSGKTQFETPAAGIHTVGYRLSHSDLYRSKSLDSMLLTYNPNPDYVQLVKTVMRRIAPTAYSRSRTPM